MPPYAAPPARRSETGASLVGLDPAGSVPRVPSVGKVLGRRSSAELPCIHRWIRESCQHVAAGILSELALPTLPAGTAPSWSGCTGGGGSAPSAGTLPTSGFWLLVQVAGFCLSFWMGTVRSRWRCAALRPAYFVASVLLTCHALLAPRAPCRVLHQELAAAKARMAEFVQCQQQQEGGGPGSAAPVVRVK